MIEKSGSLTLPEIKLHNGETLKDVVQVYSMYGEPNANKDNIVVVCHALTGSHRLAGEKVKGLPDPWWGTIVGDSKALDTRKYCIICFGNLASPYGSTSPLSINPETGKKFGMDFPILSPRDIAIAQKKALDELGFKKINCVIGASLGGMIALEIALTFSEDVKKCILIAAPDRLYPQAIAFNSVQRQTITNDPEWNFGNYEGAGPVNGLMTARMLAMITYRSEQTFTDRYMRKTVDESQSKWDSKFQVEDYLLYHGQELVRRFDANCYLYLTKMMDLHDIGVGRDGIEKAWGYFRGNKLLAIGISSDMLFPNWQVEEAARQASLSGVDAKYEEIESEKGHDSFLIDFDQLDDYIRTFLWE